MAIFHHSTQIIGRGSGRSSVAAAAYRLGVELTDQRTGQVHDFTRKGGVESWHTLAPDNAPEWVNDPARLWNEVEQAEKRKDAQLCREVNIALPKELTPEQMKDLALTYAREQWTKRGMVAQVAFHDLTENNPHCHVMLTMREIGPEGFGKKNRDWNEHALATTYRQAWAEAANRALEQHGHASRIDHRTLAEQGIDREAQQHMGPTATAMERRGAKPDRARYHQTPPSMDQDAARAELARERQRKAHADELATVRGEVLEAKTAHQRALNAVAEKVAEVRSAEAEAKAQAASAEAAADAARRRDRRARAAAEKAQGWEDRHPFLSRFYEPPSVKQERGKAAAAEASRDAARAAYGAHRAAEREQQQAARSGRTEAARLTKDAEAAGFAVGAAESRARQVLERQRWESLTPAQQAQERQQEAEARAERQRQAEAKARALEAFREAQARLHTPQPQTQTPEAPRRDRGRGWGMGR